MKKLQQLRAKKGFTLVECIVAIAIFAMMSLIVMQILTIAIQRYARNDRVEKDLDLQLEKLVSANGTVQRNTFDVTLDFLKGDASSAGSMSVSGVGVYGSDDDAKDRLELNSLSYNIDGVVTPSDPVETPDPDEDSENDTMNVVKNYMHIYGSRGFTTVYATEDSNTLNNGVRTIKLSFQVADPNGVLASGYINSIKVALPASSSDYRVTTDGKVSSLILGQTIRMYKPTNNASATTYSFSIEFRLPETAYSEYGSFAKYFIDTKSESTITSATFVENINALGVYNIQQGTPQVAE